MQQETLDNLRKVREFYSDKSKWCSHVRWGHQDTKNCILGALERVKTGGNPGRCELDLVDCGEEVRELAYTIRQSGDLYDTPIHSDAWIVASANNNGGYEVILDILDRTIQRLSDN